MSSTPTHTLLVLGSGPLLGVGLAAHFARQTFTNIALVSRNASRLTDDVSAVQKTAAAAGTTVSVAAFPADVADTAALEGAISQVLERFGVPEVVIYNAARVGGGALFSEEMSEERVMEDWKITTLGLYTTARILLPKMSALSAPLKPTLLVTSGGLYKKAYHAYFSLGQSKAAQHNLTESLAQKYGKQVHVAAVVVHGLIKHESEIFSPAKIAETYWRLYEQGTEGEREVWITDGKGWTPQL